MVIAVEVELGREAKRGGIGTVVIIPRDISHSPHSIYCDAKARINYRALVIVSVSIQGQPGSEPLAQLDSYLASTTNNRAE
jgi:hypothetical protein